MLFEMRKPGEKVLYFTEQDSPPQFARIEQVYITINREDIAEVSYGISLPYLEGNVEIGLITAHSNQLKSI